MITDETRRLASIGAIAIAACIGSDMLLVSPMRVRADELRAIAATMSEEAADGGAVLESVPALTEALERASREATMLERVADAADDPGELFQRVESLSGEHGVRIQHLNPVQFNESGVNGIAYQITVNGTFDGVIQFVDSLQTRLGLTRIDLVQLTSRPGGAEPLVNATVRSVHLAVRPEAVVQKKGPGL